jgi:hypothetical protein
MTRAFRANGAVESEVAVTGLLGTAALLVGLWKMTQGHPAYGVLLVSAGVFLFYVGYRSSKMGAYVEDEHLVVRNYFRSHRLPWNAIADVRLVGKGATWVFLKDGRKVLIWAMNDFGIWKVDVALMAMIDELRAIAVERGVSDPT